MPKGKHTNHVRGSAHHRWNREKMLSSHGYVKVRIDPAHPLADPNGYTYEHLLVLASAGISVGPGSVTHHANGDKTDNRLANLEVMTRGQHNRTHPRPRGPDGRFRKADGRTWDEMPERSQR